MKIRKNVEILKNFKEIKKWIIYFNKNAFVLIFIFDIIIYNIFIKIY